MPTPEKSVPKSEPNKQARSRAKPEDLTRNEERVISGSRTPEEDDPVDITSMESFPASDPPATY